MPISRAFKIPVSIPKRVSAKVELQGVTGVSLFKEVSIPKRVSAKVERRVDFALVQSLPFQSLKGFQPKWNIAYFLSPKHSAEFQSLKGFQPKWNSEANSQQSIGVGFNP